MQIAVCVHTADESIRSFSMRISPSLEMSLQKLGRMHENKGAGLDILIGIVMYYVAICAVHI